MTTTLDINDLIPEEAELVRRMLQEIALYPQIREPVLRFLLAEDFPALVAMVRENSENIQLILERLGVIEQAVARIPVIEERLGSVEQAVARIPVIEERLGSVEQAVARIPVIEERLGSVEQAVARIPVIEETLASTDRAVRVLQGHVGGLRGTSYEDRCRQQIAAVLDGYLTLAVLADRERINTLLVNARHAGQITRADLIDGYNADIIARALDDADETAMLAVVEVSVTFNRRDLEIAARRAELIGRITGAPTAAYLATQHDWPETMNVAASDLRVTIISYPLDGFEYC